MDITSLVFQFNASKPLPQGLSVALAQPTDVDQIMDTITAARGIMRANNNYKQWMTEYPSRELITQDIAAGRAVVCVDENHTVVGYMVLFFTPEPNYASLDGTWLNDTDPYVTVHRIAVRQSGLGVGGVLMQLAMSCGISVRVDTHEVNTPMRNLLEKLGYVQCGTVIIEDGTPRIVYQWLPCTTHNDA